MRVERKRRSHVSLLLVALCLLRERDLWCGVKDLRRGPAPSVVPACNLVPVSQPPPLLDWVRKNGGFVSSAIEAVCVEGRGAALRTAREVEAGEQLLCLPGDLDVGKETTQHSEQGNMLLEAFNHPENRGTQLAVHIVLQLERLRDYEAGRAGTFRSFFEPFWRSVDLDIGADSMALFQGLEEWELMRGSTEFHRKAEYERLAKLVRDLAGLTDLPIGPFRNETRFLLAVNYVSTHVFGDKKGRPRLMPLAIDLNHHSEPNANAAWEWNAESDALHIVAKQSIPPGEELLICYGLRSNAQLMAGYGFTLEPASEPVFSFRAASVADLLPGDKASKDLGFKVSLQTPELEPDGTVSTSAVTYTLKKLNPLKTFLARSEEAGLSKKSAFKAFVQKHLEPFESDSFISPFVERLRANRAARPCSSVWWRSLTADGSVGDPEEGGDLSSARSVGSRWRSDVLRMKMSEYMCLVAHEEALQLRSGKLQKEQALTQSVALLPVLTEVLGPADELALPARSEKGGWEFPWPWR